jgi:hypothetical protein
MFKSIICALLFLVSNYTQADNNIDKRVIFLSPPRAGTKWMLYILQQLSHRKLFLIDSNEGRGCRQENNAYNLPTTNKKPPIIHTHFPTHIFKESLCVPIANKQSDLLIMIVRNPLESAIRHYRYAVGLTFPEIIANYKATSYEWLYGNLAMYDNWPKKHRLLVYYEELMIEPKKTISKIVKFIGEPASKVEPFIQNLAHHKHLSLAHYRESQHLSCTEGNDLMYHSQSLSPEEVQILYHHIKEMNPPLWNKYLSRYDKLYQK